MHKKNDHYICKQNKLYSLWEHVCSFKQAFKYDIFFRSVNKLDKLDLQWQHSSSAVRAVVFQQGHQIVTSGTRLFWVGSACVGFLPQTKILRSLFSVSPAQWDTISPWSGKVYIFKQTALSAHSFESISIKQNI